MKFLLKSLLFIVTLVLVLAVVIGVWLQTYGGADFVANFISDEIRENTQSKYKLTFKDPKFFLPFLVQVKEITLNDDKNEEIIIIKDFNFDVSISKLIVKNISADEIILSKIPDYHGESTSYNQIINFIPTIYVKNISINKLILPTNITNLSNNISANLQGHLSFKFFDHTFNFGGILKDKDYFIDFKIGYNFINHNIKIDNFKLLSKNINLDGIFEINNQKNNLIGKLEYKISNFEKMDGVFDGIIDFSGSPSTPYFTIKNSGHLAFKNEKFFQIPKFDCIGNGFFDKKTFHGNFNINSGSLNAKLELGSSDQKIYIKNLNLNGNNLTANSNLSFDNKTKIIDGDFNLNSTNISELKSFFPFLNKGAINIKTNYKETKDGFQQINILGNAKNLSTDFVNCDLADIEISIKDFWSKKLDYADIKIKSIPNVLKDFTFKAKNNGNFISFSSLVKSINPYNFDLNLGGKIFTDKKNKEFEITTNIKGKFEKVNIENQNPVKIKIRDNFFFLESDIKISNGKLNVNLSIDKDLLKGKLLALNIPANIIADPEIFKKSLISGVYNLSGSPQFPIFDSKFDISNIKSSDKNEEFTNLKILANYHKNQLSINSDILKENKIIGTFNGELPYALSLSPFKAELLKNDVISAKFNIKKHSNILSLFSIENGHKLSGDLYGELKLSGTINSPNMNGTLFVDSTKYRYTPYGIKMRKMSGEILAQNKNILFKKFVANDYEGKLLEASGKLSILKDFPFNFNITTNQFNLLNTPYVQGEITGTLSILGNNYGALAQGKFNLGPMEIKIPERFAEDIPTLNIIEIINNDEIIHKKSSNPYILKLNIDLNADRQVYVRGRGVSTLLAGNLKITNEIGNIHIFGKLKSVRGRYQEFGKSLTVKEGIISFNGPISPSPYVNIIGFTVVDGVEISLILSGSIFNPDIKVTSNPSLNQENALSLLLFGKNSDTISTMQVVSLADGMRRLAGKGSGFDVFGIGRKILHVDDINVKNNDDDNSTSIGIGKYITDRVYVEIEDGTKSSGAKTKIEVEISPKISIEGVTSETGNSSIGLNWRFDY